MTYVADAHALYWFLTKPRRVGSRARRILEGAQTGTYTVYVPVIALAEIQFILEREHSPDKLSDFLSRIDAGGGFEIEDLTRSQVERLPYLGAVPEMHDRMIVALAIEKRAKVLTTDPEIEDSKLVDVVW
ncbi:MAG: PIN domain-containing protein [Planctomycetota bacterium]